MILVTGATGHLGSAVINQLLKKTSVANIAAFVRDEAKAENLKKQGVEVRVGNFDDVDSLDKALKGIEKVLIISTVDHNRFEQHKNVVDAAKKAGVKLVAYTSVTLNDLENSAIKPLMESHFQTEDYIKQSGLAYTFYQNSLYADVIPMYIGDKVFENSEINAPVGDGKAPYALRREMGEAIANGLSEDGHENKSYPITNTELYSFADVAKALSELTGQTIAYNDIDAEAFKKGLADSGAPEEIVWLVPGFLADTKAGNFEVNTGDLEKFLGRRPADLKTALQEIYGL
ncbi:SDR family oxidoreductase [Flavobacterium sp.]|uniref:SDR family oxidoreductase n=1 Tax=Flavobacterium sp. TaxID=239 RepID=UPI001227E664|nr:SDR family oxidoreductase [Flavobacterium sp.]RZJ71398.1 MAG: SDR family oxidoreductase [Flavobacterium sp.]